MEIIGGNGLHLMDKDALKKTYIDNKKEVFEFPIYGVCVSYIWYLSLLYMVFEFPIYNI